MLKNLSIKFRLIFIISFLSAGLLGIGLLGLVSMGRSNEGLRSVYEDRTLPLENLSRIELRLLDNRLTAAVFLAAPSDEVMNNNILKIENNIKEIDEFWSGIRATALTPEEKRLAEEFSAANNKLVAEGWRPLIATWRTKEIRAANGIVLEKVRPLYEPVGERIRALRQYQLDMTKQEYQQAQHRYTVIRNIFFSAITFGLAWVVWIGFALIRSIINPLNQAVDIANAVAAGDLTSHIQIYNKNEAGRLLQALKDMNDHLVNLVGNVRLSADAIIVGTGEIASGNNDLAQRTEEQSSSLQETASSMEELTSTVKQNAENAIQANQLAKGASEIALKGGQAVSIVVDTMSSINESSRKIVDIISVIDGIAFQTNILALNAAVEAARAGEQGRGFAVVAGEVRNLAQRSAAAAKEIKQLIGDSVEKVEGGMRQVDEAGQTMIEIVNAVKRVTDIMAEISAASSEQSAGIDQVNKAIVQMDEVTQQNAALVEEASAAAESMEEEANNLAQSVSVFKLDRALSAPHMERVTPPSHPTEAPQTLAASLKKGRGPVPALPKNLQDGEWTEF